MDKNILFTAAIVMLFLSLSSQPAQAQSETPKLELGAQFPLIRLSEFDTTDPGVGGRMTYNLSRHVALEGEINFFPRDRFHSGRLFSRRRIEGLFGLKSGIRSDKIGLFGKARPGFMRFNESREPIACIAIFPTPLACVIAAGKTEFALDLGGVVEFYPSRRSVVRFDLGDTLVRFGEFARRSSGRVSDGFITHNLQFNAGVAFRF